MSRTPAFAVRQPALVGFITAGDSDTAANLDALGQGDDSVQWGAVI